MKRDIHYRDRVDDFLYEVKNTPCIDCGYDYHPWVMEFDHIGKKTKIDSISNLRRNRSSLGKIRKEIAKCELVCANCHRMRTFSRMLKKSKKLRKRFN